MDTTGAPGAQQAELGFTSVNGVRLAYDDTGRTGIPLVLVHGSWGSHRNWDPVVQGWPNTPVSSPTTGAATATVGARPDRDASPRTWTTSRP